jgi:hypothetical protein
MADRATAAAPVPATPPAAAGAPEPGPTAKASAGVAAAIAAAAAQAAKAPSSARAAHLRAPEHPCAALQRASLACSAAAGDARAETCFTAFESYKACMAAVRWKERES